MNDGEAAQDDDGGSSGFSSRSTEMEISDEERKRIEAERQERLAPENRPENSEVDNTQREFDPETEEFTYGPDEVDTGPTASTRATDKS